MTSSKNGSWKKFFIFFFFIGYSYTLNFLLGSYKERKKKKKYIYSACLCVWIYKEILTWFLCEET